jgi:phage terminase small subunit
MNNRYNTAPSEGLSSARRLLKHAKSLYSVPEVPEHINRHNRRQWVRSVSFLGDRWLLATPVGRAEQ